MRNGLGIALAVCLGASAALAQVPAANTNPAPSASAVGGATSGTQASPTSTNRHDTIQLVTCIVQTLTMVLGFIFVILQFRKYVAEITKTHDWNRRKASQEACYNFMQGPVLECWNKVYAAVCEQTTTYDKLSDEQKEAIREVIYYLENLGICMKNHILDEDIIWDYFGSAWPRTYECAKGFVKASQELRQDPQVYEHFEDYGIAFKKRNDEVKSKQKQAVKNPGKPAIKG
jgi:hypothetical protein